MFKKICIGMRILVIIFMPLLLLLTDVQVVTFDMDFFEKKYEEYDIVEVTGIDKESLMKITKDLTGYLKGNKEDIVVFTKIKGEKQQVFRERELLHLKDVKNLFQKGFKLRNISFFITIVALSYIVLYDKESLSKTLILSSLLPFAIISIIGIMLKLDFYKYFTYFHMIFFNNDLWQLDPNTEILIQMYPLDFFYSIAFRIMTFFIIELIAILTIGIYVSKTKMCKKNI